jgi:hypothetical protein
MNKDFDMDSDTCIDFGRSFLCSDGGGGASTAGMPRDEVRLYVESALTLIDERENTTRVIYQCAACKAENTFDAKGPGDLFKQPNYDFLPALCGDEILIFRRGAFVEAVSKMSYTTFEARNPSFGSFTQHVREVEDIQRLDSFEAIAEATLAGHSMVGKTTISDAQTDLRAEIQYPIKSMNILHDPNTFQVDTGPVLYPDLSRRCESWGTQVSLAFVAYETKTDDHADFILEVPVPVHKDGVEVCRVMHYAKTLTCSAVNTLWRV